jgi:endonuclease/exonuclease/phosphatase family metal-dependent hydrolase
MRSRGLSLALATLLGAVLSPWHEHAGAQTGTSAARIVISEYRFRGARGTSDEFVELFNAGDAPVNVSGWLIRSSTNTNPPTLLTVATIPGPTVATPSGTIINPGCYYLVANNATGGYSGSVTPNLTYTSSISDNGGVAVARTAADIVDQVGQGTVAAAYGEGRRLTFANLGINLTTDVERGIERRPGGALGHEDTNDNLTDFQVNSVSRPQNASTCLVRVNLGIAASTSAPSVEQGQPLTVFAQVTPGTVPASSGISVTGDLSAVGGSAATTLADNGVAPDAVANDNIFSVEVIVPQGNPLGAQAMTLNATDLQGRRATQTLSVAVTLPAALYVPHEIQGPGAVTPIAIGTPVMVRGVVTGKKANGFFLQTETGVEDADPNTSEGLFVPATASQLTRALVGHLVYVKGLAAELVPQSDLASPSITAVSDLSFIFDLGVSAMPAAAELTSAEVSDAGTLDQLERFEGMRVRASLVAVNGTGGDGAFHAVVNGQARPFREPGVESGYPVLACAVGPCNVPVFDGNPERLRVDSDGQLGVAAVHVSTGAAMNVTGPLDFESRTFTIVPDAQVTFAGGMSVLAAPAAAANQFTVASFFLGGTVNANRLAKAAIAIRDGLNMPDIIGVQEVENLAALTALAQAIDDGAAAGQAPNYEAQFLEDSDAGVGVLVKQAGGRVTVNSFEAAGADAVMLRAIVAGPSTMLPQAVTVIVPHLLSRDGSETGDAAGALVREQRKAQSEALANFIQARQSPTEAIVVMGDFNGFSFNDGYVDVVGTVAGTPATSDQVATQTTSPVSPHLVNLGDLMPPAERYSSASNGNAQALDHALATANLASQFAGAARARINADFPAMLSGVVLSPSRLSDRDPMVAYFTFPADRLAPVIIDATDQVVEATDANGATVYYTPTATDNLDPVVAVTCQPASGSLFPLGNTGVFCSAQDAAGNLAEASFTVSVRDTTAPDLTVPSDIVEEANAAAGNVVSFVASATDAVTASPSIACSPVSGSVFALGTTTVQCSAKDGAGNTSNESFTVTVRDTTAPALFVPSDLTAEAASAAGAAVSFAISAFDTVTSSPSVGCSSSSGMFPLGTTTVNCSAQDAAGNTSYGSFTVTVQDTMPPTLTVPGPITASTTSSSGRVISFTTTATDAVTASPTVNCTPASGSTFPVGDTVVTCAAADAAGNVATGTFTVAVTMPTPPPPVTLPGRLAGAGTVVSGEDTVHFAFDVRESAAGERGYLLAQVRRTRSKPTFFIATHVSEVQMSDSPSYTPGTNPASGVDTVMFAGTGVFNGATDYRFVVNAADRGEPGRDHDTFSLTVYAPNGQVVLSASGVLNYGNIQSLR